MQAWIRMDSGVRGYLTNTSAFVLLTPTTICGSPTVEDVYSKFHKQFTVLLLKFAFTITILNVLHHFIPNYL